MASAESGSMSAVFSLLGPGQVGGLRCEVASGVLALPCPSPSPSHWTACVDSQGRTNFRRGHYGQKSKWAVLSDAPFTHRGRAGRAPAA